MILFFKMYFVFHRRQLYRFE